jgi:hypothetical protein
MNKTLSKITMKKSNLSNTTNTIINKGNYKSIDNINT